MQKEEGEKQSLKEKMQAMQEITLKVQIGVGMLAHILESVGNAFNFSVPFLSWLLFTVLSIVTVLLYYVPLRLMNHLILLRCGYAECTVAQEME